MGHEKAADRAAPRAGGVDGMARAPDELGEAGRHWVARQAPPCEREVGRRRAVKRAEAAHLVGPEPPEAPPRAGDELVELAPRGLAVAHETIYVHGVEIDDRITIATPEGVDLELTLAGVGSRFVSALVDFMLQLALLVGVSGVGAAVGAFGNGYGSVVVLLAGFLVFAAYDVLFEVFASGRTPGKRLNGLRVVRVDGSPVTFFTSAIRNVLRLVDILPGLYLVGIVTILVTRQNQRLGDVAAGTLVVRERTEHPSLRGLRAPEPVPSTNAWDATAVTAGELPPVCR